MINIVIPMAGRGSRFAKEGYSLPKPLIPVHEVPMIELVVSNLRPNRDHRFIFVCLAEHNEQFGIEKKLRAMAPGCEVVYVDRVTEGAACTVLLAKHHINNEDELMIANSDQWIDVDINTYLAKLNLEALDGLIMTMRADDKKWSFVRCSKEGLVELVVEKEVISNDATVGIYNFREGRKFVQAAELMIQRNLRSNGEFYVAPVYNLLIEAGAKVGIFDVGSEFDGMYGLGIPSDLEKFVAAPISQLAIQRARGGVHD